MPKRKPKPITAAEQRAAVAGFDAGFKAAYRKLEIYKAFVDASARAQNKFLTEFMDAQNKLTAEASKRIKADDQRADIVKVRGIIAAKFKSPASVAATKKSLTKGNPR